MYINNIIIIVIIIIVLYIYLKVWGPMAPYF